MSWIRLFVLRVGIVKVRVWGGCLYGMGKLRRWPSWGLDKSLLPKFCNSTNRTLKVLLVPFIIYKYLSNYTYIIILYFISIISEEYGYEAMTVCFYVHHKQNVVKVYCLPTNLHFSNNSYL